MDTAVLNYEIDCLKEREQFLSGENIEAAIKKKALSLCQAFVGGKWSEINKQEEIDFKPIGVCISNSLFYCSLPSHLKDPTDPKAQVLIRIFGRRYEEVKETDSLVFLLLGERGLGPKLFGVFPGGRIEEFINSRALRTNELRDPLFSKAIARKLAMIHSTEVPINKNPNHTFFMINKNLNYLRQKVDINKASEVARQVLPFDFESEVAWLQRVVSQVESPLVFAHNDLLAGNMLLRTDILEQIKQNPNKVDELIDELIVFVDFEFCSYNSRGQDIGNHFGEYAIDFLHSNYPYFKYVKEDYPSEAEERRFIRDYLAKLKEINLGKLNAIDTEEHLFQEVRVHRLAADMFWILEVAAEGTTWKTQFGFWEKAKSGIEVYLDEKNELLKMGILKTN